MPSKNRAKLFESTKWKERLRNDSRTSTFDEDWNTGSEPSRRNVADWMRREVSEGVEESKVSISLKEMAILEEECSLVSRVRWRDRSEGREVLMKIRGVCSRVMDESRRQGWEKNVNGVWSSESDGSSLTWNSSRNGPILVEYDRIICIHSQSGTLNFNEKHLAR